MYVYIYIHVFIHVNTQTHTYIQIETALTLVKDVDDAVPRIVQYGKLHTYMCTDVRVYMYV